MATIQITNKAQAYLGTRLTKAKKINVLFDSCIVEMSVDEFRRMAKDGLRAAEAAK